MGVGGGMDSRLGGWDDEGGGGKATSRSPLREGGVGGGESSPEDGPCVGGGMDPGSGGGMTRGVGEGVS